MIFFFSVRPPNVLQGMNFFMPNDFGPEFMSYFHVLTALVYNFIHAVLVYNIYHITVYITIYKIISEIYIIYMIYMRGYI